MNEQYPQQINVGIAEKIVGVYEFGRTVLIVTHTEFILIQKNLKVQIRFEHVL